MKTLAIVWGLLLAAVLAYSSPLDKARELTVLITNNSMGGMGAGTGVLIDPTHVLTCFHMLETPKDDFMVYTYPLGRVVRAHAEGGAKGDDLMILVLESSVTVKVPPVFQNRITIGEPITVVGNALGGMLWFVTKGVISGESQGFLLTDALINPGNSGGPWFNDKGEIVGISDWGIGPLPHIHGLSGGISSISINRMLDAWAQQRDMMFLLKVLQGEKK